jgi:hypothetical protein
MPLLIAMYGAVTLPVDTLSGMGARLLCTGSLVNSKAVYPEKV